MIARALLFFIIALGCIEMNAQDVVKIVTLEGVDIQAVEDDFDTDAFIDMVKNDSSFYLSFKALNYYPSTYDGWLKVFKKGEKEKGHVIRKAQRHRDEDWMWVEILSEEIKGKIQKKNGQYKYLTAETWNSVFYPAQRVHVNMSIFKDAEIEKSLKGMEKRKAQVKKMMFNPGVDMDGVPLVGKKLGIFNEEMHQYYTYSVYSATYQDSIKCLVFEAEVKPEFRKGKTVIKSLTTYFNQESNEVMQREVKLSYFSLPMDFDIFIKVENQLIDNVLLPKKIYYKGFFDVPFMKKEQVEFLLDAFIYDVQQD